MTSLNTNMTGRGAGLQVAGRLSRFGAGLLAMLVRIAERSPKYRALQAYGALSDADLARIGMTRADVVARVFGARAYY